MKKVLSFLLVAVLAISLAACGGGASSSTAEPAPEASSAAAASSAAEPAAEPETSAATEAEAPATGDNPQYPDAKVVALMPGPITDNGWNANAYKGIVAVGEAYGCTAEYVENVATADLEDFLRGYGNQGYNMVVVHGSEYIDVVNAVAPDYPDTYFMTTFGGGPLNTADNYILAGPVGSGIMSGIVAGALTETGNVAFLGGEAGASISPIVNEFDDGVALVDPEINVHTGYIGTLSDQSMAKEQALALIAKYDIDVISVTADAAGIGVLQAAEEAGITAIGFNADQHSAAPDAIPVSVVRDFGQIFKLVFGMCMDGTVEPKGVYALSIGDGVITLSDWYGDVPQEKKDLINTIVEKCKNGEIDVPAIVADNAAI